MNKRGHGSFIVKVIFIGRCGSSGTPPCLSTWPEMTGTFTTTYLPLPPIKSPPRLAIKTTTTTTTVPHGRLSLLTVAS